LANLGGKLRLPVGHAKRVSYVTTEKVCFDRGRCLVRFFREGAVHLIRMAPVCGSPRRYLRDMLASPQALPNVLVIGFSESNSRITPCPR